MSKELLAEVTIADAILFNLAPVQHKESGHLGVVLLANSYVATHYWAGGGSPHVSNLFLVVCNTGTGYSYTSEENLLKVWKPIKSLLASKVLKLEGKE